MPYCPRCGVEVDDGVEACRLCDAPIPSSDDIPPLADAWGEAARRYPSVPEGTVRPTTRQLRLSIWATLSAIFLISLLVVLVANLVWTGGRITWSGYALGSIGLAWGISTVILVIFRPPWLVVLCTYPLVVAFLALVDLLDGSTGWLLPIGLPIVTSVMLSVELSTILWSTWKDRGANQLAILLVLLALSCLLVDLVTASAAGRSGLTWSFVVLGVIVPLSGFLFIYHYVLRRILKLERIFHV
jgi:hypothetical protein